MALKQPTDLRYPLPPKPRLTQNWHPRGPGIDGHVGDLGTTQRLSRQSLQIQTTVAVPALAPELHESIEPPLSRSPLPDKLEAGDNTSTAGNDASLDYSKNNSIIIKSPGQASLPSALPYPVDSLKDSTSQQHLLGSQMTRKKTKRMVRRSLDASWPYSSPQYKLKTPKVKTTKTTTSKPTGIPVPGKFRRRQPKAREWTVEKVIGVSGNLSRVVWSDSYAPAESANEISSVFRSRVIESVIQGQTTFVRIKWENTTEPLSNLKNAKDSIEEYYQERERSGQPLVMSEQEFVQLP